MNADTLIFVFVIFGLISLVYVISYFSQARQLRAWQAVAERTGLACDAHRQFGLPFPSVSGTYRNHTLTLDTFTRGSGKTRRTYTRVVLFVNNQSNAYFALYEETVFSKIGKFFGARDVQVGDEQIDKRFVIKSQPENYAAGLLTSINLRQKLLQARALNVEVDGRELHFEQIGILTNVDYILFLFDLLSDLAEAVERAGTFA